MIDIGIIAKGRRLMHRPAANAIHRLLLELRQDQEQPTIELVYIIPGELGKADFEGFEFARRKDATPVVFIDVPANVAEAGPEEPVAAIIDLARSALEFARGSLAGRPDAPDLDPAAKRLDAAQEALLGKATDTRPGTKVGSRPVLPRAGREPQPDSDAVVEVTLSVDDQAAIERAFRLEDALEIALTDSNAGYVDGNEIGGGTFRIFIYGPSPPLLRDTVTKLVSDHWSLTSAEIRSFDGDKEVDGRSSKG